MSQQLIAFGCGSRLDCGRDTAVHALEFPLASDDLALLLWQKALSNLMLNLVKQNGSIQRPCSSSSVATPAFPLTRRGDFYIVLGSFASILDLQMASWMARDCIRAGWKEVEGVVVV